MFSQFPKVRPSLPDDFARIYTGYHKGNRGGNTPASSLSQRIESWLHKQVASDVRVDRSYKTTLEIGAGTLNQLPYEPEVGPYDIVEPFKDLYEGSMFLNRIRNIYADIGEISVTQQYDRITSIATFEHICNLPEVIARAGVLLKPSGVLRVSIPSEGTCLWTIGWKITTGLEFRIRYGLDFGLLMRYEHVNTAREIEDLLHYFFNDINMAVFGLSKKFSLYQFYKCACPQIEKCHEYLERSQS